jgi:protein SCO1/2
MSLSVAADAMDRLGAAADDVAFMMISVDPDRDELTMLGDYVRQFDERFVGVGGGIDAISDAAALYGVFFHCGEPDDDGRYLVDHTSTLIGIDPSGELKVLWDPNVTADRLADDLRAMTA